MKIKVKKDSFEGKEIDRITLLKLVEASSYLTENWSLIRRLKLYSS